MPYSDSNPSLLREIYANIGQYIHDIEESDRRGVEYHTPQDFSVDSQLSVEEKLEILDLFLKFLQEVFIDVEEYTIFGGIALFFHTQHTPLFLNTIPQDFDVLLWNQNTLDTVKNRLHNVAQHPYIKHVDIDVHPQASPILDSATVVYRARLTLLYKNQLHYYPLELFYNPYNTDLMVDAETRLHTMRYTNLTILNPIGLERQIKNNLRFELIAEDAIQQHVHVLTKDAEILQRVLDIVQKNISYSDIVHCIDQELQDMLQSVHISAHSLIPFYAIQYSIDMAFTEQRYTDAERLITARAQLFGPLHTRVAKRLRSLEALQVLSTMSIET